MGSMSNFEVRMRPVSNSSVFSLSTKLAAKFVVTVLFASVVSACGDSSSGTTSAPAAPSAPSGAAPVKDAMEKEPAPAEVAVADGPTGEETYNKLCLSCHASGLSGAPKIGSAEDWAPRKAKGLDALVASTITGVPPAMPARGLCFDCSDDQLRATVAWMIEQQ